MKRTLTTTFAGLIAAAALLTGCGQNGATVESSQEPTTQVPRSIVGTWGKQERGEAFLVFKDDGNVEGTDGCNGIHTTYTKTDDGAQLEPFVTTMRACIGVNAWLRDPRRVVIEGDTLTAYNAKGTKLGTLEYASESAQPSST